MKKTEAEDNIPWNTEDIEALQGMELPPEPTEEGVRHPLHLNIRGIGRERTHSQGTPGPPEGDKRAYSLKSLIMTEDPTEEDQHLLSEDKGAGKAHPPQQPLTDLLLGEVGDHIMPRSEIISTLELSPDRLIQEGERVQAVGRIMETGGATTQM